jgi:hypothetical protein
MMRRLPVALLFLCVLSPTLVAAENPREIYQRALVEEQGAGNLRQAIDLYERVAKSAGPDRALAAKALVRAAECYEKLGEPKAAELYAQVVRAFPEQQEAVSAAQLALVSAPRGKTSGQSAAAISVQLTTVVAPMLDNYCVGCHNQTRKAAGLALDQGLGRNIISTLSDGQIMNPQGVDSGREVAEKVLARLRSRTMPPAGQPHPDTTTNQAAVAALETALDLGYPQPLAPGDLAGDTELASRMAKFLWNADPDQPLLEAANRGRLSDPGVLQQQVRRMLLDPKSEILALQFFDPWLHLGDATKQPLTPSSPAELDESLRKAMRRETQLFVDSQVREDHPAMDLWSSNYTFVNDRLAQYYGIPNVSGNQFRRVTRSGNLRAGLLGQGSILTLTSLYAPRDGHVRTSPAIRGKWFYATFFGLSVPPPPPSVSPLDQDGTPTANTRERMEAHRKNPSCASCHQVFDPFGFALENFDAMGRFRDQDGGEAINASGMFADGSSWTDPVQFKQELVHYQDAFVTNATEVLLSYALGRTRHNSDGTNTPGRFVHAGEMPEVRAILREAAGSNYSWSAIITGIVKSQSFQLRTVVP